MPAGCVIGVDLGGTKALAGVVEPSPTGPAVRVRRRREIVGLRRGALLDTVVSLVEEVRAHAAQDVEAIGFGIPCLMDHARGRALLSVHLPLVDFPFGDVIAERLGLPVFVDNDANLAALAEHRHGSARGCSHAVLLTLGTGIGGGLILNDELFRGASGAGAELGHVVIDRDGPRCQGSCPNRGCLEALASGSALVREAHRLAALRADSALASAQRAGRELTGPLVTELAYDGDDAARAVITTIGQRLGIGIASFVNVFDPQVVVVGGGVIGAGELLLEPARAEVAVRALPPGRGVPIVAAHFGAEAGMVGAGTLALEGLRDRARAR